MMMIMMMMDNDDDDDDDDGDLLHSRLGLTESPPVNRGWECSCHLKDNSMIMNNCHAKIRFSTLKNIAAKLQKSSFSKPKCLF